MGEWESRKRHTEERTAELQTLLKDATAQYADRACVYATGSFGRLEAGEHSDLDLCIVSEERDKKSKLSPLDEICLKAELITAVRTAKLPDIDGDGRYLGQFTIGGLVRSIGSPEDDAENTFTARLLLLLESRPLFGDSISKLATDSIISAYWLDFANHKNDFVPAYFSNDILRLWRTFCVNYEARTRDLPVEKRAKRRVKNYKLKHSRILTCYSAILYMLEQFSKTGTVTPQDAVEMCLLTPKGRIVKLLDRASDDRKKIVLQKLLDQYERFLEMTDASEEELAELMNEKARQEGFAKEAAEFGETMFDAVNLIGDGSSFHRLVVV